MQWAAFICKGKTLRTVAANSRHHGRTNAEHSFKGQENFCDGQGGHCVKHRLSKAEHWRTHLICKAANSGHNHSCAGREDLIGGHGVCDADRGLLHLVAQLARQLDHALPRHPRQNGALQGTQLPFQAMPQ